MDSETPQKNKNNHIHHDHDVWWTCDAGVTCQMYEAIYVMKPTMNSANKIEIGGIPLFQCLIWSIDFEQSYAPTSIVGDGESASDRDSKDLKAFPVCSRKQSTFRRAIVL